MTKKKVKVDEGEALGNDLAEALPTEDVALDTVPENPDEFVGEDVEDDLGLEFPTEDELAEQVVSE